MEFDDNRRLGIATLGALKRHPRISSFRQFVEGWYLSYFAPDAARSLPLAGPQRHLSVHGDNLGNVVQFMERQRTLASPVQRQGIPRTLLRAAGIRRNAEVVCLLAYARGSAPPPFICVEEPENGLHHRLLEILAREFRDQATRRRNAPQLFVTTHQPYFVNALSPRETWIPEKGIDGFATIRRASDDAVVESMVNEGLPLGSLWYSDYLD